MMRRAAFPSEGVLLPAPEAAGDPRFAPVPDPDPVAAPAAEPAAPGEGLQLLTDSELVGHETLIEITPQLLATAPTPLVDINRADAARIGISNGQAVRLRTERGTVSRPARISGRVPAGVVYTPDNLDSPRINALLDWQHETTTVQLEPVAMAAATADAAAAGGGA